MKILLVVTLIACVGLSQAAPRPCPKRQSNRCLNGATCITKPLWKFECACAEGFTGQFCDEAVPAVPEVEEEEDEDAGGTMPEVERQCRMFCHNGGQCKIDPVEGAKCICAAGFTGSVCENAPQASCMLFCQNGGRCEMTEDGPFCACEVGYRGDLCELKDEDDAGGVEVPEAGCRMLCQNGGRCQMDAQLGAMCVCAAGFAGHICEQPAEVEPPTEEEEEEEPMPDIKCLMPCYNGGKCVIQADSKQICQCPAGFEGPYCANVAGQNEDSTGTDPLPERQCRMLCQNGGQCKIDPVEGAKCICATGFSGSVCENAPQASCMLFCQNGGRCEMTEDGPFCACEAGFRGPLCDITDEDDEGEVDIPLPEGQCRMACDNGGMCQLRASGPVCACTAQFDGEFCEIRRCPIAQTFVECGSMCEPTCDNPAPALCTMGCRRGCECPVDRPIRQGDNCLAKEECEGEDDGGEVDIPLPEGQCRMACGNGGMCQLKANGPVCVCTAQFDGEFCENRRCPIAQMFVECGSMCEPTCDNPAPEHCVFGCRRGCECPADRPIRQGDNCLAKEECEGEDDGGDVDVPLRCPKAACENGGYCQLKATGPVCVCADQFDGEFCQNRRCPIAQTFVECGSMCEPTCDNPAPALCTMGCRRGCECPVDRPIRQGDNCLAKEECPVPEGQCRMACDNGGMCQLQANGPVCVCTAQFDGEFCENRRCPIAQMFVECGSMCEPTCNNPAPEHCVMMCRRGCECPVDRPIRQGDNCLAKEECPVPEIQCLLNCENDGECDITPEGIPQCICAAGFTGHLCADTFEAEPRECQTLVCQNGGTCVVSGPQRRESCECTNWFEGNRCQKLRKFNCKGKNPCHMEEPLFADDGIYFYPHLANDEKYVQCGGPGSCYEMSCASGLVWDYAIQSCNWP